VILWHYHLSLQVRNKLIVVGSKRIKTKMTALRPPFSTGIFIA